MNGLAPADKTASHSAQPAAASGTQGLQDYKDARNKKVRTHIVTFVNLPYAVTTINKIFDEWMYRSLSCPQLSVCLALLS